MGPGAVSIHINDVDGNDKFHFERPLLGKTLLNYVGAVNPHIRLCTRPGFTANSDEQMVDIKKAPPAYSITKDTVLPLADIEQYWFDASATPSVPVEREKDTGTPEKVGTKRKHNKVQSSSS